MMLKCCQAGAQHAAPLQGEGALARIGGFLAVDVFVFDVALGVGVDGGLVGAGQGALDLAGVAYYQAAGGDFGALEEQGAGGHDAAGADFYAVEDDGAHADQASGLDGAAVKGDAVADGDVVAEEQRIFVAHNVEDAAVLNIGARADANVVHVAADDGARPDAGVGADDDVADDDSGGVNVGGGGDCGPLPAVGSYVGLSRQCAPPPGREDEGWALVNRNTPLPPGFLQVFILKTVKVLCFDTLLQVLILNDFQET